MKFNSVNGGILWYLSLFHEFSFIKSLLCMQVMAYLDFLKKHALPLPSRHSMACSLAFFIMQRKMLTASLLSGPPTLPSALSSGLMESNARSGTMDLILDSLCEALETGTASDSHMDETASEFRMVTLASPQYLGNEQVVRRVSLHKVVVDASLKVLSFLALKYGKGYEEKQGFLRLLNILFPDTQLSVAWLEERNGEKMPLLTEDQALLFARCSTPKLIRAGEITSQLLVSFSFDYSEVRSSVFKFLQSILEFLFTCAICCSAPIISIMYVLGSAFHVSFGLWMFCNHFFNA